MGVVSRVGISPKGRSAVSGNNGCVSVEGQGERGIRTVGEIRD